MLSVSYPDDLLSEGEQVLAHKHPHFKMLIVPVLAFIVTLGLGVWVALLTRDVADPWDDVALIATGGIAVILIMWRFLTPLVRWRTTHFIVTTDRVIAREGVLKRTGIDMPMARINSVRFEHDLVDRILGCGTLIIESASDEPLNFDDIPQVERMHALIYRQVNDNPHDDPDPHDRSRGAGPQEWHDRIR